MKNSILYIVGAVALLGGGAFLFLKNKKTKDNLALAKLKALGDLNLQDQTTLADGVGSTVVQTKDSVLGTPIKPLVKTLTNDDLLAIQKLRDVILADMNRKGTYKKQSSRNNVQADINKNIDKLKEFGYALDTQNNLIKIAI
jgi:LPXTG-motif cell wall-anchored protein